jgi:Animal haem peroxidase
MPLRASVPPPDSSRKPRFGRMFAPSWFPSDDTALRDLSEAMKDVKAPQPTLSSMPAGFAYLGQFVAHDVSFDQTQGIPSGFLRLEEITQGRSPALDLDGMYGGGPKLSPEFYELDRLRLRLGSTTGRQKFGVTQPYPNDLPRRPAKSLRNPRQAIVGDPRNDQNLGVAQTHVAFLKFHNRVVLHLQKLGINPAWLFDEARKAVVQHYQWIVLYDLLPRITDHDVYKHVLTHGRMCFFPMGIPKGTLPYIPVEFSGAAYRLDSMIRSNYGWNRVFNSRGSTGSANLNLRDLFKLSKGFGDLDNQDTLPSDAIVDWQRFYDFSERPKGRRHPQLNFARAFDTSLVHELWHLPQFSNVAAGQLSSLAAFNLLRGRSLRLPTGQEVVQAMQARGIQVAALTPTQIASGPHRDVIEKYGFNRRTPLWYYIQKEAREQAGGQRLGQLGSRLVIETLHGLIEGSSHSILKQSGWKPTLPTPPGSPSGCFTMLDLLDFAEVINPLGD